ncbi:unnamed protein product, partial [Polarella glacialis]
MEEGERKRGRAAARRGAKSLELAGQRSKRSQRRAPKARPSPEEPRKRPASAAARSAVLKRPAAAPAQHLEPEVAVEVARAASPLKPRRDCSGLRGLQLMEVPLAELSAVAFGYSQDAAHADTPRKAEGSRPSELPRLSSRPRRHCLPPLETWRNERVVFERPPGSPTPQIRGVVLNTSADPSLAAWAER